MKCPVFRIFPAGTDCRLPDGTRWKHGRWKMSGKSACRRSSGANSLTGKGKSGLRTDLSTENGDKYDDVRRKGEGRPAPERCIGRAGQETFPGPFFQGRDFARMLRRSIAPCRSRRRKYRFRKKFRRPVRNRAKCLQENETICLRMPGWTSGRQSGHRW